MSEQNSFFEEHGWVVLRAVVSADTLTRMTETFDRVLGSYMERANNSSDEQGKSIWQVPGMCKQDGMLLSHFRDGLGERVADLLEADCIQLLQDTFIVKPARVGADIELHQDYTYTGYLAPPKAVSVRLSLTASTVERGCMYVIDRSHRWGLQGEMSVFSERLQQGVADRLPDTLRARVVTDRVPLELAPGDVSVHHCLTCHGSFENTSSTTLKTIVTHVFDGACKLAADRLPDGAIRYFETEADGRLSRAAFPVLFDRRSNP